MAVSACGKLSNASGAQSGMFRNKGGLRARGPRSSCVWPAAGWPAGFALSRALRAVLVLPQCRLGLRIGIKHFAVSHSLRDMPRRRMDWHRWRFFSCHCVGGGASLTAPALGQQSSRRPFTSCHLQCISPPRSTATHKPMQCTYLKGQSRLHCFSVLRAFCRSVGAL